MKLKSLVLTTLLFLTGCATNDAYINQRNLTLEKKVYSIKNNELVQESNDSKQIKLGIVTDIHNEKEKAEKIAKKFNEKEVDSIIVAGDTSKTLPNIIPFGEREQIKSCLTPFLKTGKPVYVIAGNHETKNAYFRTMNELAKTYNNLFDLATLNYADLKGVNIFGVSGGGFTPLGGFSIKQNLREVDKDVFSLDKDPVLMVSHVPPKFNHKRAIDCVYDVKLKNGKIIESRHKGERAIYQGKAIKRINPRNKGLKVLTDLIKNNDIEFGVSGHYHMNKGADNFYKNIPQEVFASKLFMNPGGALYDMAGILTIKNNQAKYKLFKIKR